jgi:ATP-binding cassette subfamily F protein uup
MVLEAENVAVKFFDVNPPKVVINNLSIRILQGEKIGIIGRNGAGKSTLLRLITGSLAPTAGSLRLGSNLNISYFDQKRETLDNTKTLWETLCPNGGDTVKVGDQYRHIVAYLKDFLFDTKQLNLPVSALSGGEANRLLLAKILAQAGNFLILDEPTNDLDMDSLDMLEELLAEYKGTLILVSHDREFLNNIVTRTLIFDGSGNITDYYGSYEEFQLEDISTKKTKLQKENVPRGTSVLAEKKPLKISYKDKRDFELLPDIMQKLEDRIKILENELNSTDLYQKDQQKYMSYSQELEEAKAKLHDAEIRFIELDDLMG